MQVSLIQSSSSEISDSKTTSTCISNQIILNSKLVFTKGGSDGSLSVHVNVFGYFFEHIINDIFVAN